jgi:hypothetical protein
VRTLLRNDALLNSVAPSAFRDYNTEQMIIVDSPKGKVRFFRMLHVWLCNMLKFGYYFAQISGFDLKARRG